MSSSNSDSTRTVSLLTLSNSDGDGHGRPEASASDEDLQEVTQPADPKPTGEEEAPEEEERYFKAEVMETHSELLTTEAIRGALGSPGLSDDKDILLTISACDPSESVRDSLLADPNNTFYLYTDLFVKLSIRLPFSYFVSSVLAYLRIAPSQLSPNGWAFLRSFEVLCYHLRFVPSHRLFFYFFHSNVDIAHETSWVSLSGICNQRRLDDFTQSFKGFKSKFFKVTVPDELWEWVCNSDG